MRDSASGRDEDEQRDYREHRQGGKTHGSPRELELLAAAVKVLELHRAPDPLSTLRKRTTDGLARTLFQFAADAFIRPRRQCPTTPPGDVPPQRAALAASRSLRCHNSSCRPSSRPVHRAHLRTPVGCKHRLSAGAPAVMARASCPSLPPTVGGAEFLQVFLGTSDHDRGRAWRGRRLYRREPLVVACRLVAPTPVRCCR